VAALVLLPKLGSATLEDWDEAIFAQISREMVRSGDWLTPHWGYAPYFNKPPLLMWLTALAYLVLGVDELAARIVSALAGVGVVMVAYLIGREVYGRGAGALAALVLLSSLQFVTASRFGTTDVLLTLLIALAALGYLLARERSPRWWYLGWGAFGLACMVKGAGALVIPAAVGITLLVDRRLGASLRSRHFWYALLVAAAIALPWHLAMVARYGSAFMGRYVAYNVVDRSTQAIEGHAQEPDFYLLVLHDNFLPWIYLLPVALALTLRDALENARPRMVLVVAVLVFVLYSAVGTKLRWYIMPMYPMLAVMLGATLRTALADVRSPAAGGVAVACLAAALAAPQPLPIAFAAIALLGGALVLSGRAALAWLAVPAAVALLALVGAHTLVTLYREHPGEERDAIVAHLVPPRGPDPDDPLVIITGINRPTALFYTDRAVVDLHGPEELVPLMEERSPREVIVKRSDAKPLERRYRVEVLGEYDSVLYARVHDRAD
jgi:4-amino-4-deoxy-L-arabinose transferase-like glycosyltransferase